MAVIGSIRKRTGLLIGIIAVALLMFLLMDALSSNSLMGGSSGQNVGKINGKKVDYMQYQMRLSDYEERITTLFPSAQVNASNRAQFRDEVWNSFAKQALLGRHLEDMAINVTPDELGNAMFGDNIHFFAQNVLVNPNTGQFDRQYANAVVKQAEQGGPDDPARKIVRHLENLIEEDRIKTKYASLFTKGIYVPDFMAKAEKQVAQTTANVSYIAFPFSEVEDSEISFTDKDLQKYMSEHEDKFSQDATREIKFYTIDIVPSAADTADALDEIKDLKAQFMDAENDSIFVRRYSDIPFTGRFQTRTDLTGSPIADSLFEDDPGKFYGPYFQDGSFKVAKLKQRKLIPDSVSARHILLVPQTFAQADSLRTLADSLIGLLKAGKSSFETLAPIHSQDQSNKNDGGDLGYFTPGMMVPTFNNAAFYKYKEGDIYTVESQFGIHIVKIDEAEPVTPAVKVAFVSQRLSYSKDTERHLFREANTFRTDHNTAEKFEAAEGEYLINTATVTKNQVAVLGLTNARDLVQWAFKEKVGSVNYFDIEDKYIVALISGEKKEGANSLESVRVQVEQLVKNEKKAKVLADRIKSANASNIQELASSTGKEVSSNPSVTQSSLSLSGAGNDAEVIGYIFGMENGEMSGPLEGSSAVFVVQLNSLNAPQVNDQNLFAEKAKLRPNISYQAILDDLKKDASIEDERYLYY